MDQQNSTEDNAQLQSRQQAAFPPPPPYYRLFRDFTSSAASTVAGDHNSHDIKEKTINNENLLASASGPNSLTAEDVEAGEPAAPAPTAQESDKRDGTTGGLAPGSSGTSSLQFPMQPPPLPGDDATFQIFGELHTAKPGIPPLAVKQLYEASTNSAAIDFPGELRQLNRELLFSFVEMLSAVAERPSQSARSVETVGVLVSNIQHLLNLLRPHQAAATLEHLLTTELEEQQAAISDLRAHSQRCRQLAHTAAQSLAEVGCQGKEEDDPQTGEAPMETDVPFV